LRWVRISEIKNEITQSSFFTCFDVSMSFERSAKGILSGESRIPSPTLKRLTQEDLQASKKKISPNSITQKRRNNGLKPTATAFLLFPRPEGRGNAICCFSIMRYDK
jgi:hypothetical protein